LELAMKIKKNNDKNKEITKFKEPVFPLNFNYNLEAFFDNMLKFPSFINKDKDMLIPDIDISKTDTKYKVKVELSGVKEEDIEVEYSDGSLIISAEKQSSKEEKGEDFYRQECSYGSFYKTIGLPQDINENSINANYKNGVLKIDIDRVKTAPKQKKKIGLGKR